MEQAQWPEPVDPSTLDRWARETWAQHMVPAGEATDSTVAGRAVSLPPRDDPADDAPVSAAGGHAAGRGHWLAPLGTLAVAAGLVLWLTWLAETPAPEQHPEDRTQAATPPVAPRYASLRIEGVASERGEEQSAEQPRPLRAGEPVRLLALPQQRVPAEQAASLQVRLFAFGDGAAFVQDAPAVKREEGGALVVDAEVLESLLPLPAGQWTVVMTIAEPGALPDDPEVVRRALLSPEQPTPWSAVRQEVEILEPGPLGTFVPEFWVNGCEEADRVAPEPGVLPGATLRCRAHGQTMGLWTDQPPGVAPVIRIDGQAVEPKIESREDGRLFLIGLPKSPTPERLTLTQPIGEGQPGWSWAIEFGATLDRAFDERLAAARLAFREQRSKDALAIAVEVFEAAVKADEPDRVTEAMAIAAYHQIWVFQRYAEADGLLKRAEEALRGYHQGLAHLHYHQGLVHSLQGHRSEAAHRYGQATRYALAVADLQQMSQVLPTYAGLLVELGRYEHAVELGERGLAVAEARDQPCVVAKNLSSMGWAHLLLRMRGHEGTPRPYLERALKPDPRCKVGDAALESHIALAELALLEHAPAEAREHLAAARAVGWLDKHSSWRMRDLELRLALDSGEDTGPAWEALVGILGTSPGPEQRWLLALRRGEIAEAEERREDALLAYAEAEAVLEQVVSLVALSLGRDAFMAQRHISAARRVALLHELGRDEQALCSARLARSRPLRHLDLPGRLDPSQRDERLATLSLAYVNARAAYDQTPDPDLAPLSERSLRRAQGARRLVELQRALDQLLTATPGATRIPSCESLRSPAPGELLLTYVPMSEGWLGFSALGGQVRGVELSALAPEASPEQRSQWLLGPFEDELGRAEQVTVVASGELLTVDLHALPWEGAALVASHPVAYALDLPAASSGEGEAPLPSRADAEGASAPGKGAVASAVLVADPTGTLRYARREIDAARSHLVAAGWDVVRLGDQPTRADELREALGGALLFHFAGHGVGGAEASVTGQGNAYLRLSERNTFGVVDVLAQGLAPRHVVLSGCETGVLQRDGLVGGVSLAHAFLAAGSQSVIATTTRVQDGVALALGEALYGRVSASETFEPVAALRRAQLELRGRFDDEQWASFRVWLR